MIISFLAHKPRLSTQYRLPFGSLFCRLLVAGYLLIVHSATAQCVEQVLEHTGSSNIMPYETNDGCFVEDNDFAYDRPVIVTIDESELRFPFYTRRYVGAVDGEGFLENAGQLVDQGVLSEWVTLTFVGEIVLPDALGPLNDGFVDVEVILNPGTSREISLGPLQGGYFLDVSFSGQEGPWQQFLIDVYTEDLRFPQLPACGQTTCNDIGSARNELMLKFSGRYVGEGTSGNRPKVQVDWISAGVEEGEELAWRPALLVHGLGANNTSMDVGNAWADGLIAREVEYVAPSLTPRGSIQNNGREIWSHIFEMKNRIGVDRVNIVGHSKGGLDAREYTQYYDDVKTLIMLGTPNVGTPLAQIVTVNTLGAPFISNRGLGQASVTYMQLYNAFFSPNDKTTYVSAAGDHDGQPSNTFFALMGENDNVVPVTSVEGLPYADAWTYFSSDITTDHSGLRINTRIVDELFDVYLAVPQFAGKKTSPSLQRSVREPFQKTFAAGRGPNFSSELFDGQIVAADGGAVEQGQTQMHEMLVDDADTLFVTMLWEEEDLSLELLTPGGLRIDPLTNDPSVSHHSYQAEEWPFLEIYRVVGPETGTWILEVAGVNVTSPEGAPYALSAYVEQSRYALDVSLDAFHRQNGDPVTIYAHVEDDAGSAADANVGAIVVHPDLTSSTAVVLRDDGMEDDPTAGDGQFTGLFSNTSEPGLYSIQVTADGTVDSFRRVGFATTNVAASRSSFTGMASDHGVDSNGDGLYDSLAIEVEIDVDLAGSYRVFATLTDGNDTVLEEVKMERDLEVGIQNVELSFGGAGLHQHELDGPYSLAELRLIESDTDVIVDERTEVHTTAPYLHTDFQQPLITLTGVTSESVIDYLNNGILDVLNVEVEADFLFEGDYQWSARLYSQDEVFIAASAGSASFSAGTGMLTFSFQARDIVNAERNGPYVLKNLTMAGHNLTANGSGIEPAASLLVSQPIAVTEPYTLEDFGGEPRIPVELTSFDVLVDSRDVVLTWETASETNNAGFEVQMRPAESPEETGLFAWQPLAFVEGSGTTVEAQSYTYTARERSAGRHQFRLKQIDFDGRFAFSEIMEATIQAAGTHELSAPYPNPFNPKTTFWLVVQERSPVRISVHDALGRQLALLHDDLLSPGQKHYFTFDGEGIASGLYLIRIEGTRFSETKPVMLNK